MRTTTIGVKGGHFTKFIYTVLRHLISDQINHQCFIKFRKILWKRENSAARLEIPQPAENCGP